MNILLERDAFLATLNADLRAAAGGEGRTILVSGEAGIGKTTLLEHFVRGAATKHVLWGGCEALFTPHPLGPLHDLARESQGKLKTMLGDGTERAALFSAVLDELSAAPSPAVLILEDVHWADAATLDLITFLGRRIHRVPALMILSVRDNELDSAHPVRAVLGMLPSQHVRRLPLALLSPDAVSSLAAKMKRSAVGLHATTGGNPFFVTEVLANSGGGVPATVRDAVLGRAANLSAEAREVLELASIVPRAIEVPLIEKLLSPDPAAVEECVASGLLIPEGRTLRFRHELARVAVEESIAQPRAQRLHARMLAELSAASAVPVALARLVHHAHLSQDDKAVLRLAPQAAREAASRGARREAAAHCKVALTVAHALPEAELGPLLEEYAGHCFEINDLPTSISARESAIVIFERLGDVPRQVLSLARHAMTLVRALRNAEADAASKRAIELAESLPPHAQLARAYSAAARLRMLNRDYAESISWGEKAIVLAEKYNDRDVQTAALTSVGASYLFVDYPRGLECLARSMKIAELVADGGSRVADAYAVLGSGSGEVYRLADATRYLEEGIAYTRDRDLDRLRGYMEAWLSLVHLHAGRWEAAGELANAVLSREQAETVSRLMALVALGRLRTRRGDPGAELVLDEALALAEPSHTLQRVAPMRCARAEAAWLAGDLEGVRREARGAYDLALEKGHAWFAGELAYWLWRAGALNTAPAVCAGPYALQIAGKWQEAVNAWEALDCPYEQARALAEGDEEAQRKALALFDRLGAGPMGERLRHEMRAAGVQAIPRGPRASTRDNAAGLTAREVEVLELVAQGMQNAQIASQLSRSPRTVDHHIAAILDKLGVGSRNEAVAVARERGLLQNR